MTNIIEFPITEWNSSHSVLQQEQAVKALENGNVLFFPQLAFTVHENETKFLSPDSVGKSKNVGFNINTNKVQGSQVAEHDAPELQAMMNRFANSSRTLVQSLLSHYTPELMQARTSLRPVEISGRASSWRKDDTRLHFDAFPATPVHGKRILRVFSNVNPDGKTRSWRVGEQSFEQVAKRFIPSIADPLWQSDKLLHLLGITKSRRTAYDHFMLHLHDSMKKDNAYQASEQTHFDFPANSTWICFADGVPHAVLTGQHLMEQTFYLPVSAMQEPALSPLKVLERLKGRALL
jgi:hypothetical protein